MTRVIPRFFFLAARRGTWQCAGERHHGHCIFEVTPAA